MLVDFMNASYKIKKILTEVLRPKEQKNLKRWLTLALGARSRDVSSIARLSVHSIG